MGINKIIAIASAKGGVGKSTVCANLAYLFSKNSKVGILDADIYGPNQHIIFQLEGQKPELLEQDGKKFFKPIQSEGININSMGFILDPDKAAMWRGPMLSGAIKQLKDSTQWGDLDYLFIDMPPGTGDAYLTIASDIKPDAVILVTTQSPLAIHDTLKSKAVFDRLNIPILGYVDNMSFSICEDCGKTINDFDAHSVSNSLNIKELGVVPRRKDCAVFDLKSSSKYFKSIYNELLKII